MTSRCRTIQTSHFDLPGRLVKKHLPKSVLLLVAVISACAATAYAGPPFLTDDPEPVEYHHGEFYVFSILDATNGSTTIQVPAFELNYGIAEETQAHIIAPLTAYASDGNPTQYGLGDLQLGVKYRFLKETEDWPQLGIYPMLMVPTGNVVRGLGNGSAWAELPLWAKKVGGNGPRMAELVWRSIPALDTTISCSGAGSCNAR